MKRLFNGLAVAAILIAVTVFAARGGASNPPAEKPTFVTDTAARNPCCSPSS
jgi:hypothetical protein